MPPKIPTFNLTVSENAAVTPYKSANVSAAAFDKTMGADDLGRGLIYESKALDEIQEQKDKTAATELYNQFNSASLDVLHNKEYGYLTKTGKAALDSTQSTLETLQKSRDELIESAKNDREKSFAYDLISQKYSSIEGSVRQYESEQNQIWKKDTLNNTIDLQTQEAIINKYNTKAINNNIGAIRTSIAEFSGETDPTLLKALQDKATSNVHIAIIEGRLGDKALNAKEYFEAHKNEIDSTKWDELSKMINTNDADVRSRLMADEWFASGLSEEQAYEKAHGIKDLDLRDALESKVNQVYGRKRELEKQAYNDKLDEFWNNYADNPDVNNIPAWMEGKDRITAKNFAESEGKGKADVDTYVDLYEMSATNAEAFVNVNLNQYRDRLTKDEFKSFSKRQQDIRNHGYSAITPDDKAVKSVVKSFGSWGKPNQKIIAEQMQKLINEEERRTGQKYSAEELKSAKERIGSWLGYSKESNASKVISQSSLKADFYKGLANDLTHFQKVHNRQPDAKEFRSVLYQRANSSLQEHNTRVYEMIKNTSARPHESKTVTYFAHTYLPELGKKLGTNISVAPDQIFNPKSKSYKSYHNINGISHATDVSMSGRNNYAKWGIVDNILKDFPNAKIGTSDAVILRRFEGNKRVVDEREFDKKHGTNHVNHIHVTLKPQGGSDVVVAQKTAPSGKVIVADKNGDKFYLPEGQLSEALRQGYKRI